MEAPKLSSARLEVEWQYRHSACVLEEERGGYDDDDGDDVRGVPRAASGEEVVHGDSEHTGAVTGRRPSWEKTDALRGGDDVDVGDDGKDDAVEEDAGDAYRGSDGEEELGPHDGMPRVDRDGQRTLHEVPWIVEQKV